MDKAKPYPGTQAVLRAVSLLKVFTDERPEWGLTELAQEVELNKTTTYRLLTALDSEGMVARNPHTDTYRLGPAIVALGGCALRTNDLRSVARPELEKLASMLGETASLEIQTGREMLILDEVAGEYVMSGAQAIGTRWPAYATSTGKALLAAMAQEDVIALLSDELLPITPKTVTSLDVLRKDLAQTRKRGYAIAKEELELGLIGVGAAVRNFDGEAVGAISLSAPTIRLTAARVPEVGKLIVAAAQRISSQLGFHQTQ